MAAHVYTERFYTGNPATGATLFTVPAGFVYVITDISCVYYGSGTAEIAFGQGSGFYAVGASGIPNWTMFHWSGRWAINAAEEMLVSCSPATFNVQITGYALTLP
jgi:hypothetical protein